MTINPKLLEPTLLWSNANPTSSFTSTGSSNPISIPRLNDFKYLVFLYKNDTGDVLEFTTKQSGKWKNANMYYVLMVPEYNGNKQRVFLRTSATSGYFLDGKTVTNTTDNSVVIPTAIYGTNIL